MWAHTPFPELSQLTSYNVPHLSANHPVQMTGLYFATADPFNNNNCSQPLHTQHNMS